MKSRIEEHQNQATDYLSYIHNKHYCVSNILKNFEASLHDRNNLLKMEKIILREVLNKNILKIYLHTFKEFEQVCLSILSSAIKFVAFLVPRKQESRTSSLQNNSSNGAQYGNKHTQILFHPKIEGWK